MSAAKYQDPLSFKLFEPSFHAQRPIIVDPELQSPETVALVYEEEAAARANGGGLRGDSPTGLLPMSAYKPQPPQIHGFADSPYSQFSPQSYASQPTDHATPQQINSLAFASNSAGPGAGGQYVAGTATASGSPSPVGGQHGPGMISVLSCHPSAGSIGTKVCLRVSSQTDLTTAAYLYVSFGEQKCAVDVCKDGSSGESDDGSWIYSITAAAPQFVLTNCESPSGGVPVTLFVDSGATSAEGLGGGARVVRAGTFTYHLDEAHGHGGPLAGATGDLGQGQQRELDDGVVHHKTQATGAHVGSQSPTPPAQVPQLPHPHQQSSQQGHLHQQHHHQAPPHLTIRTNNGTSTSSPIHQHQQDQQQQAAQQQQLPHPQHLPHHEPHHHQHNGQTTNTFGYSPTAVSPADAHAAAAAAAAAAVVPHDPSQQATQNFVTGYNQGNTDMLSAYRTRVSFSDPYRSSSLRSSGGPGGGGGHGASSGASSWMAYPAGHDPTDRYDIVREAALAQSHNSAALIGRPSISSIASISPSPTTSHQPVPRLMRTSMIPSSVGGGHHNPHAGHHASPGGYGNPWVAYPSKAILQLNGSLDSMVGGWTPEEWSNKRRIVLFKKKHHANVIEASFRPVPVGDRPTNSICISCIYWQAKGECFVTSVDTIHLLEQLVQAPGRFCVEEKNRIRRNLEGFKPITVSKSKPESDDFFKLIMGFGNPKPRNIEKDVKVFPWKILGAALKKIISKYSQTPSSSMAAGNGGGHGASSALSAHHHHHPHPPPVHHLLTPVSLPAVSSYPGLPPTPVSATTATDPSLSASGYVSMATSAHLDSSSGGGLPSPRSLPASSSWSPYATAAATGRTMSPSGGLKTHSPGPGGSGLRISTLPPATNMYDARSASTAHSAGPYGMHSSGGAGSRWDAYDVPGSAGSYSAAPHHHSLHAHSHHHGQVYGSAAYGGDAQRA